MNLSPSPTTHVCWVVQSMAYSERFARVEQIANRTPRVLMAPWFDEAKEFHSSMQAEKFARLHFAPDTYQVRTKVNGYLLPISTTAQHVHV